MTIESVITALDAFVPSDDETDDACRLYEIFEGFRDRPDRMEAMGSIFSLMERYPDAILGTPGPLVHELEDLQGYAGHLRESVLRQPSYLTVWMINRILNAETDENQRRSWHHVLEIAVTHPSASQFIREEARGFIEHQRSR